MAKIYSSKYTVYRQWQPGYGYLYQGATVCYDTPNLPWYECWPIQSYGRSDSWAIWNHHWGDPCDV